jgi:hypothetical protein
VFGWIETVETAGLAGVALTEALSVASDVPRVAVTIAVTGETGAEVVTPKKAVFDPAGTVVDPGATLREGWLLES